MTDLDTWIYFRSSNVKAARYDQARRELRVRFQNDAEYVYSGVPGEVFTALMAAGSAGQFLNERVKGVYPYRRV